MIFDIIIISVIVLSAFFMGFFIGRTFGASTCDGVITMTETDRGLIYSLELSQDPEFLMNQSEVKFKVVSPNYEKLLSR